MDNNEILNKNLLLIYDGFARVAKNIELFWGHSEFPLYVTRLLADNTSVRKGFPADILFAIVALQELHDVMYPQYRIVDPDNWTASRFGLE